MKILISERMAKNFNILEGALSPAEARQQLAAGNYGVVLGQDGTPAALLEAEDLERALSQGASSLLSPLIGFLPMVVVGSAVEMRELVDSEALTLFEMGARGAVVSGDEGIVGVLPVEAVDEYLGSGGYELSTEIMGPSATASDASLGGQYQTPEGAIMCVARVGDTLCGHLNKVAFLDKKHLPLCQNPNLPSHTLKIVSR